MRRLLQAEKKPDREKVPDAQSNIPIPDPSILTTEALQREISILRELLQTQIGSLQKELDAFKLNHEEKHRGVVDAAILHRKEQTEILIKALRIEVQGQIVEMDRRYQERFEAQTEALSAAFTAQQTATQAALASADQAVQTALASAEKAVVKSDNQAEIRIKELAEQVDRQFAADEKSRAVLSHAAANAAEAADIVIQRRFAHVDALTTTVGDLVAMTKANTEQISGLDRVTDAKFVTFRTLIDSQAEKVALALAASDKAVSKAEAANERRFESVNEFRAQLSDQTKTFISRAEFSATASAASEKIEDLKSLVSEINVATIGRLSAQGGRAAGLNAGWVYLLGALGAIGTIISIMIAFRR